MPQHEEGYYMAVGPKGVVIAGRDERGLYYGVQTLRDIMSKGQLETCTIQDWPDVKFRGAIEGFYGRPWSHEHRLRQIDFYGRNKMNVYIYGPKDDPYHRQHWREAYPEQEAKLLQELNVRAHQRGVNFYWAIHPGLDILTLRLCENTVMFLHFCSAPPSTTVHGAAREMFISTLWDNTFVLVSR